MINALETGSYFGEISLLTNLKTTATVRAVQSCTLGSIEKEHLMKLKEDYPSMFLKFTEGLSSYQDIEFDLRR